MLSIAPIPPQSRHSWKQKLNKIITIKNKGKIKYIIKIPWTLMLENNTHTHKFWHNN